MKHAVMAAVLGVAGVWAAGREADDVQLARQREAMVRAHIEARGIRDRRVLDAMRTVPRHLFMPDEYRRFAHADRPLPIGAGQTISQPYVVAFMTEALDLKEADRVLEIGTGSGYQAAILAVLVREVYTIELLPALAERARRALDAVGCTNVHVRAGDGYKGWPEKAPFDAVIVTCAPEKMPGALVDQLREGGRLIVPVGEQGGCQQLVHGVKKDGRLVTESLLEVRFVPMVREP